MEDENGLELSLGLSCGGSSGKSKIIDVPSDHTIEERSCSRLSGNNVSDFSLKNFFEPGIGNLDHKGEQKSDSGSRQQENFLSGLGKFSGSAADGSDNVPNNLPQLSRYQELWMSNNKPTDAEKDKSVLSKRKFLFEEINLQKKQDKVLDYVDTHGKTPASINSRRNSHVSVTTEDGSFGENEDVAESEAEGSNSWLVTHREDSSRSSDIPKYSESNPELGKLAYGIPLSLQPPTVMNVPYPVPVKVSNATTAPSLTGFPTPCAMQLMPLANSERPLVQPMNTSNLQLAFGYSPVQLPTLETNPSRAFGSQPPHISSFASRDHADGAPNLERSENNAKIPHGQAPHNLSAALAYEGISSSFMKGSEIGASSSQIEAEGDGSSTLLFRPKEAMARPAAEAFPHEGSNIRAGIASNLKFGGCGSYPDLPWVSTSGPGPNGKTISGVTYKYSKNQIKIVCACHGSHMSPEEFVQHASEDAPNPENITSLA